MPEGTVLDVDVVLQMGIRQVPVRFALTAAWTSLFGPSGSGKTTVLRAVAGFTRPQSGRISVAGQMVFDHTNGVSLPAHRRGVRTAAQQAWLFAGTVRGNLVYGAGDGGSAVVEEVLRVMRLEALEDTDVRRLSGGERQRLSVGRAVVAAAAGGRHLLLLDEPFGGMDAELRDRLAVELRDWLLMRGVPVLSVTHDVGEAFLLGAEVVRMGDTGVEAQGPAGVVLAGERERLLGVLRAQAGLQEL